MARTTTIQLDDLKRAIREARGNMRLTAKALGISPRMATYWVGQHDLYVYREACREGPAAAAEEDDDAVPTDGPPPAETVTLSVETYAALWALARHAAENASTVRALLAEAAASDRIIASLIAQLEAAGVADPRYQCRRPAQNTTKDEREENVA
jgi:hypothetical protein